MRKVAQNILLTVACIAFWCLGVALFSQDPHGVDLPGFIGGLWGLLIFALLHRAARKDDRNAKAPRHAAMPAPRN